MNLPEASHYEQPPAGTHTAVCIAFIDLGTQQREYMGEKSSAHQIMLRWELPGELMDDGQPFTVGQFYTWSMNEKAKLREHLESWRNLPFTKEDLGRGGRFDIRNLLGKPCTLMIVHNDKGNARVSGVGPKMKNVEVSGQHNESLYVALTPEDFDRKAFDRLSDKMRQMVERSPEFQHLNGAAKSKENFTAELDDEIPF